MEQELEGLTSIYGHALPLYQQAGWSSILPVPPSAKSPPPTGYTGRTDLIPTDADYETWLGEKATWNIALRLPDGVIGIDIDDYDNKHGAMSLEEFAIDRELPRLPSTWSSSSREGESGIYLFRVPAGRTFVSSLAPDIEVIQPQHRYAVVWPSVHPRIQADGTQLAQYRWRDMTGRAVNQIPRPQDLALLPPVWVDALTVRPGGSMGGGGNGGGSVGWLPREVSEEWIAERDAAFLPHNWAPVYDRVVQRMIAKAAVSTRHDAIVSATASIVGAAAQGMMPGSALWRLAEVAESLYEERTPPGKDPKPWRGDNEHEFWAAVGGAIAKHVEPGHPWWERIQPAVEAEGIAEWLGTHGLADEDQNVTTPQDLAQERLEAPAPAPMTPDPPQAVVEAAETVVRVRREIDAEVWAQELELRRQEIERWLVGHERVSEVTQLTTSLAGVEWSAKLFEGGSYPINSPGPVAQERWDEIHIEAELMVADRRSVVTQFVAQVLPHWVEQDWLPKGVLATMVAPPSVGKTLWAVDLSCRLAMGMPWFGTQVERCPVLYLAHEAHASAIQRVVAWSQHHAEHIAERPADPETGEVLVRDDGSPKGLVLVPMTGSLRTEGGRSTVRSHAEWMHDTIGAPGVVIIDTLAAGFGEGEENSATDMQAFLTSCYSLMGDLPGLTFLILHHPVKDAFEHPDQFHTGRGSGALKGAVSVELACRRIENDGTDTGLVEIARLKARDGEQGTGVKHLAARRVIKLYGPDGRPLIRPDHSPVTSVVLDAPTDEEMAQMAAESLATEAAKDNEYLLKVLVVVSQLQAQGEKVTRDRVLVQLRQQFKQGISKERLGPLLSEAKGILEEDPDAALNIEIPQDDDF